MKKQQKGVALIEFALVLPILVLIVFGIIEFGRAFSQYNALVKSVRDATRYLSTQSAGSGTTTARNLVVYGLPGGGSVPIVDGLDVSMVSICDASNCSGTHQSQGTNPVSNLVTVTISGVPFSSLTYILPDFSFSDISFTMRQP